MTDSSILPHSPDLRYLAQIIQLAVAPVFLLAGLGAFLNVCAGRLARIVGLSRSSFAERFTGMVGQPPMQYLALWRMQVASRLLVEGGHVAAVASAG